MTHASAFVLDGALSESLVYSTCQEMYFQYAKIQPFLAEARKKLNLPEFFISIERVVEGSTRGRERLVIMRNNLSAMAAMRVTQAKEAQA